jgi:hypothetical protein
MTMRNLEQQLHESFIDSLMTEPLCVRANRLEEDGRAPGSPDATKMSANNELILSSPTSIMELLDALPEEEMSLLRDRQSKRDSKKESKTEKKKKKRKKDKKKLFRPVRRKGKEEEESSSSALDMLEVPLTPQEIEEAEEADFWKLREEEENKTRLDNLMTYPLTIMEEVMMMSIPDSEEETDGEYNHEPKPMPPEDPEQTVDLGRFEKDVERLRLSQMDLRHFVSDATKFARMQQELRDRRCITNETLRQTMYILCSSGKEEEDDSHFRDIFSEPAHRKKGWNKNVPLAYRRMNEFTLEIDWNKTIEDDEEDPEYIKSKKKWTESSLLKVVTNYSQKGRESYHTKFQDGVEEKGMVAYGEKFQDGVELLKYCARDLIPIVKEELAFRNLQRELRKIGAVTNGVLKQGLHFYVRDNRLRQERLAEAASYAYQKECFDGYPGDEDPWSHEYDEGDQKRLSLLKKLRLRPRFTARKSSSYSED